MSTHKAGAGSRNENHCSFCGKSETGVDKLIAGPAVAICNECVDLCHEIIHEKKPGTFIAWLQKRLRLK